jgi:hypothetical protein
MLQPAVEHPQAAVAVGGSGGLPAGELVGDERLDILAPCQLKLDAAGCQEPGGQPRCVEVGLDGAVGLVGPEVQLEGARQTGYAGSAMAGRYQEVESVNQVLLNRRARLLARRARATSAGQGHSFSGM